MLPAESAASPHDVLFWEMNKQTAVRAGRWKLVLNGQLVEGAPPEDEVHLADLDEDMGERTNLAGDLPEVAADLKAEAEAWRGDLEELWEEKWQPLATHHTAHPTK